MAILSSRTNRIARFRAILNDLKRDEETAARELGEDLGYLREILSGKRDLPQRIIRKATATWPINERDLLSIDHDAPEGVVIMTGDASERTTREIVRGDAAYYEYRDLAMTRTSEIRPEWIRMLHEVDDDDPHNPTIRWNKGHLLFQFTYFRGDINYYYEWNGVKRCARMSTGDSVFGLPYAPHSFALRKGSAQGHILALTFAGRISGGLRDQVELLPPGLSSCLAPAETDRASLEGELLKAFAANAGMQLDTVANMLGWGAEALDDVVQGRRRLDFEELKQVAGALKIPVREIIPPESDLTDGVVIRQKSNDRRWPLTAKGKPAAYVQELATSELVPYMRGIEIEMVSNEAVWQRCQMHTFAYNIGDSAVELRWESDGEEKRAALPPESSCVVLPYVSHAFTPSGADSGRVLLMRTSPQLTGDAYLEALVLGPKVLERMRSDLERWY